MPIFKKKAKRRYGSSSKISKLNSPYVKKLHTPRKKVVKKSKKTPSTFNRPRIRKAPENNRGKKLLAAILSIGIISYTIYAVFISDYFLIKDFEIVEEGTIIDNYEKMNNILQKLIGQNLVLVNEENIIITIKEDHPEIENVKIKKVFPDLIKIEYEKYPVAANLINTVEGIQKKFIVDSQGFLVEENIEHPDLPRVFFETTEFLEFRNNFLGSEERSEHRLSQIISAINLFEEKFAMKILYAEYKKNEREVHLHTEKNFYVMIDLEKNINRQIEKLKKALPKLDIYNESLVYIDLRISSTDTEKIIYKKR
jgi:cell division septal protein FtsQ